jgi:3'-phosphoadenosine 5'-phosphosulfate sulfotransferase (PAPS reductase)/FAD synthetase
VNKLLDESFAILDEAIAAHNPKRVYGFFSGGHDSLTATAIVAKHPLFTGVVHINTGIGIEETRAFVRDTCRERGWPLFEYGPPDKLDRPQKTYEQMVLEWGFPSPQEHKIMYGRLKQLAVESLLRDTAPDRVLFGTGIRKDESVRRMRNYAGGAGTRSRSGPYGQIISRTGQSLIATHLWSKKV